MRKENGMSGVTVPTLVQVPDTEILDRLEGYLRTFEAREAGASPYSFANRTASLSLKGRILDGQRQYKAGTGPWRLSIRAAILDANRP